ncbi:MAG: hypothetical protein DDT30_01603 [Dehalococcoidia bacterium]|nr:hypothetical protein [Bacillota bacterium]
MKPPSKILPTLRPSGVLCIALICSGLIIKLSSAMRSPFLIPPKLSSSSSAGGNGLRSHSHCSNHSAGELPICAFPIIKSSVLLGSFRHLLKSLPSTALFFWERMFSKSHASTGYICTGVAVASSMLCVFNDICKRKSYKLLGSGFKFSLSSPKFLRLARCASSTITHSYCIESNCSQYSSLPLTMIPCEMMPTRRGHLRKSSDGGYLMPFSSTHSLPL